MRIIALVGLLLLAGCADEHPDPPKPNWSKLVPVTPDRWDYTGNDIAVTPADLGR